MKSTKYSEKVLDHFRNPRNVGALEGDDVASGTVGNPTCGDIMEFFIKVKDDKIVDAKFRTFGCASAIATSSMTTEMVIGMTLDEAMKVERDDVAGELDGLPPIKLHCSNLAADALHEAINSYRRRESGEVDEPDCDEIVQTEHIVCKTEFENNGLYRTIGDPTVFGDQRTLVIYTGDASIKAAIKLTDHTDRVILLTCGKDIKMPDELNMLLGNVGIKILYQSQLLEIRGDFEVERALIKNLDEDEEYELFIDAVVILG